MEAKSHQGNEMTCDWEITPLGTFAMNCLACDKPLITLEYKNFEIDFCENCRGIWLDAGELGAILEMAEFSEAMLTISPYGRVAGDSSRQCPVCARKMHIVEVKREKTVSLDTCPENHGIWFDRGELRQVATALAPLGLTRVTEMLKELFPNDSE